MDLSFFRRRRVLLLGGAAVLLVVLAVTLLGPGAEGKDGRALIVEPKHGPFAVTVTATGELRAQNSTQIRGPSGAQRARIYQMTIEKLIPEGTVVEKGDFVAQLDRSELTSNLKDAQDNLRTAQSDYESAKLDTSMTLSEARDNLVNLRYAMEEAKLEMKRSKYEAPAVKRQAEINYEKAERAYRQAQKGYGTQVQQARAKVMKARTELSKTQREMNNLQQLAGQFTIKAPQDGMLIYRRSRGGKLEEGDQIRAWDPVVATLPDLSTMESVTYVNEVDIQKIREGQPVEVGLDAAPDTRLDGTVTSVANVGEQRPGSSAKFFQVVVEITEQDATLRPGMTTSNTIVTARQPKALHVPLEAVHAQGDSLSYVFVEDGGHPVRQQVELGLIGQNRAVAERGLERKDALYLSVPTDTSGLAWNLLESPAPVPEDAPSQQQASGESDAQQQTPQDAAGRWTERDSASAASASS